MERIEKTVFISYRRTNAAWALAIYQNLTSHGYDVFFDYLSIASGDFEQIILGNIASRAHFIVILTPSALERCAEPGDWLRREIEYAIDQKRNIIPLMFEGFDFKSPAISDHLTGKLAALQRYQALNVPPDYFFEAMERLRGDRFLNQSTDSVIHPPTPEATEAAATAQREADAAPAVTEQELTAEEWFEHGLKAEDPGEQIRCYTEAIRLNPQYAAAYNNRGAARSDKGDPDGAIADYNEALRLNPRYPEAYYNRGNTRYAKRDLDGAIADYSEALRLKPHGAFAYNRGNARAGKGDLDGAMDDYNEAIRLNPQLAEAYVGRGNARAVKGDLDGAIADFDEALRLKPQYDVAHNNRGFARLKKNDLDGAIADYTEALRLNPQDDAARENREIALKEKAKRAKGR